MKKRLLLSLSMAILAITCMLAQNSAPAPGTGGGFTPNMGGGPGPNWGSPWGPGYMSPSIVINAPVVAPPDTDSGVTKVIGCGYDAQGIWRTIPLTVSYNYNGVNYNVMVLNAWNPWTDMWNRGVNQPAYSTSYFLRGTTFDYYTNLSTGTYYFNL